MIVYYQMHSFKFKTTRQHTQIRCSHTHKDTHTKLQILMGWWWLTDKGPYTCLVTFYFPPLSTDSSRPPSLCLTFLLRGSTQRLSHASLSTHGRYSETVNGSLNQCDASCHGFHSWGHRVCPVRMGPIICFMRKDHWCQPAHHPRLVHLKSQEKGRKNHCRPLTPWTQPIQTPPLW